MCANFYVSLYVRVPMLVSVLNECVGMIVCRCVETHVYHCAKNPMQLVLITI